MMTDSTPTPNDDMKVAPATEPEAVTPTAESTETASDKPAETAAEAAPPAQPTAPRRRWASFCLDAFLVLLLLAVLGTAAYCFRVTTQRYHVPSPMELMLQEREELEKRHQELVSLARNADTQLHLRARLAQLDEKLAENATSIDEMKGAVEDQRGQVLAAQYAIRQADATNRSIARNLLPGMPVGTVTTTTGKAYRNATIYRLDKRYIYIRFPEGQVRFPLRQLVKGNLPDMARYAFGELDLVDMSDFEQTGDEAAKPRPACTRRPAARTRVPHEGYDPAPGAPVLDTEANRTTTSRVPEEGTPSAEEHWDAPSGELPM